MYRQHGDASAGPEQQYQLSAGSSLFNYSPFSASTHSMLDTAFQNSPQHLSPAARPISRQTSHVRNASTEWQSQQTQSTGSSSPRPKSSTPSKSVSSKCILSSFTPQDRSLPSRNVNADTITDAYVAFILYCNPSFGLEVDTSTLRSNFQTPPKSDNKDFEIFRLFELIKKFDSKEIRTWSQLALDLGVEAPDVSKGQSVQKVQQYSVRLKRWMRAMHVDAFFEYLLGKQHAYSTEIPHPNDPHPASGRDGVLAEEDLAIRALDPAFRPKRGRRRNSEVEQDNEGENEDSTAQLAARDDGSQAIPSSAHPMSLTQFSATPSLYHDPWTAASAVTPQSFAPWMRRSAAPQSAATPSAPSNLRWQLQGSNPQVATPHPMTAMSTSMSAHIESAFESEPRSANTPSSRKRRKHGPAVSSAWPSSSAPGAKPRGRPPASRNVQDGPFSTFPADPANDKSGTSTFYAPIAQMDINEMNEAEQSMPPPPRDGSRRPGRLSLQVPPHTGGPVRLATPPRVTVTAETSDSDQQDVEMDTQVVYAQPTSQRIAQSVEREFPGFAFEALKRVVASDLLRAELIGRRTRLNGDEAKRLADVVLLRLNVPRSDTDNPHDDIARLTAASWLGVGGQLNVPLGPATGQNKRITVTRLRLDDEGYEEIVSAHDDHQGQIREVFDLSWTVSMGSCSGSFDLKGLTLNEPPAEREDEHDLIIETWMEAAKRVGIGEDWLRNKRRAYPGSDIGGTTQCGEDGVDWKSKYRALEFGSRMAKGEFHRFRQRLVERVLDLVI